MMIETDIAGVRHPKGKILLMNGTALECFGKKDRPALIRPDEIGIDRTGEYFSLRGEARKPHPKIRKEPWMELFFKEAFFLYGHREEIYSDSRMFLTPLPFENGLAYTGGSGLRNATLGVYLEWWDYCGRAVLRDGGGVAALTYFIAGSPLSGRNVCSIVKEDGTTAPYSFPSPFGEIWKSFMEVNRRYSEARQIYQAYTLEETVARLRGGPCQS